MTKAFGARVLFEDASLQVNRGDRIGLVGPNGAGKSTLFSLVLGHDTADEGEVQIERNGTLGHLPQETAPVYVHFFPRKSMRPSMRALPRAPPLSQRW